MPTVQPTMMMYIEPVSEQRINVTTQVNIYLTGVPSNQNMTTTEQEVFESLFYTLLQSRLETVDVGILEVVVDAQINDPQFDADSPFDSSQSDTNNGGGETKLLSSVLQLVTNVTLTYSDPPPEGWRDWSIYLTSWIESFGPTMVDIFTDPKHKLYPNQEFFNTISDVSGTNVVPPNTDPTMSPTLAPTYLGAPEYKKPLVTGLAVAGVVVVVLFFGGAVWWKWRRVGLARTHNIGNGNDQEEDEEEREKKEEEEEEELGSIDEDNSLPQDVVVASLPSSTVPKSNSDDDVHDDDDDEEGEDDNNDDDESEEGDDDDESESEENIVTSLPMIIEETAPPTPPRQESPTLAPPLPNELKDDDVVQYNEIVAAVMANDPNLTQVVLDNKRQIGNNDGGEALWEALSTNNHVQLLSLRNSNITDDQMAALALALNENTSISRLSLQSNMFTSEGVEYLIVCLVCNSTIDVVDLEGNSPIDPRILDELCGILQSRGVPNHSNKLELLLERIRGNDPNLTQLDLRGMGIGQEDNDAIMDALAGNAYLRKVDLSDNMIDDDGVSALSLALADNTSITHMCLAENRITSIGAEYLLCALDTNDTIVDVDLAGNSIDAGVMDELNHALKQRRTVDGY
ncbi:leucine-rich repeat protein [Skeletonema marinoi]|uniref:Leucine-rich repeat protein n=1 Tax=Skeletonema marinoi TaxID=267567 RepID=A0AAD8XS66_9STRA|nr:leucine-rich repeat protein [Skeletonema marinoi]